MGTLRSSVRAQRDFSRNGENNLIPRKINCRIWGRETREKVKARLRKKTGKLELELRWSGCVGRPPSGSKRKRRSFYRRRYFGFGSCARGNWALVHRNAPGFLSPNGDTTCESWMVCKLTLTCTGRDDPDTGWVKELLRNLI